MGVVFRARDPTMRLVAVKCLAEAHANDVRYRERFRREVETSTVAKHPHILEVYDAGELQDGGLYLVMPYMPDGDLVRYIDTHGRLAPGVAARLMLDVAEALERLHRDRIIHRDVKPSNLLVEQDGERLQIYLSDFGIVKKADETPLTGTEAGGLGTPPFAAPEQLAGKRVSPPADVFAAGRTLDYLLRGPEGRGDRAKRISIDRKLVKIIKKATRGEPSRRYQTAGDLASALRNYLRLPHPDIDRRPRPSWGRRAARTMILLTAIAAAPLGFILMRSYLQPASAFARVGAVEIPQSRSWQRVHSGFGISATASRPIVLLSPTGGRSRTVTIGTGPISAKAALTEMSAATHHPSTLRIDAVGPHAADIAEGHLKDGRKFVLDAVPVSNGYIVFSCLSSGRRATGFFTDCQREIASIEVDNARPDVAKPSKEFVSALRADWSLGVSARQGESKALKSRSLSERGKAASVISDAYGRGASRLRLDAETLIDLSLARRVASSMTAIADSFGNLAAASRVHDRRGYLRARTLIHHRDLAAARLLASFVHSGVDVNLRSE